MTSTDRGSNPNKLDRRRLLLRTAETLFAQRGIDAVSLNEINKAAGQRNTSAMHYHFGSKDGLVEAIIYEHYEAIDRDINALLDEFESCPPDQRTTRNLLKALVMPFAGQLDSEKGVNYLLIVRQVLMKSSDMLTLGHPEGVDSARLRIFAMFRDLVDHLPAEIQPARMILSAGILFNSLATFAQVGTEPEQVPLGSKELFINNLLDILENLLTTAPSKETLAALPLSEQ